MYSTCQRLAQLSRLHDVGEGELPLQVIAHPGLLGAWGEGGGEELTASPRLPMFSPASLDSEQVRLLLPSLILTSASAVLKYICVIIFFLAKLSKAQYPLTVHQLSYS